MTVFTPEKAVIPPVAATDDENRHVYDEGSNADATLKKSSWLNDVPPMLLSRRISVHPSGPVIVPLAERRGVRAAIIT